MNGSTSSEVEATHLEGPAIGIPGPIGNWIVHDRGPDEDEDNGREHASTVGGGTDGEGRTVMATLAFIVAAGIGSTYVMAANMPWYSMNKRSGTLEPPTLG